MSKKVSLVLIIALVIAIIMPYSKVLAKDIQTLDVNGENGKIKVSGETESGMLAVAVSVYNEDETKLITTETTDVDNNNKYEYIIEIAEGNYVVKVADYDGGTYVSKEVTVAKAEEDVATTIETAETEKTEGTAKESKIDNTSSNPKTGDKIAMWIGLMIVSILGILLTVKNSKKTKKRKH